MTSNKIHKLTAILVLCFSGTIYLLTVSPTVSLWDCGEFIACAYHMAVPHPPGTPLFILLGRLFSLIPFSEDIGLRVNLISVFVSATTVMLLYLVIVQFMREWKGSLETKSDWRNAIFSGVLGALAFAFTHSFWFNAVEAEVYSLSMFFSALVIWLTLVWSQKSNQKGHLKYLFLIVYLIGLGATVHLLSILVLPFVVMIIYFRKFSLTTKSFVFMVLTTCGIMITIYPGIFKFLPLFTLKFGQVFPIVLTILVILSLVLAYNNKKKILTISLISVLLILISYSSYGIILIRSNLNPTIDMNNPENLENFYKYVNREQYGTHSITIEPQLGKCLRAPNSILQLLTLFGIIKSKICM